MKKIMILFLTTFSAVISFTPVYAMEMFAEKGSFLKSKIYDIQYAYYIPEDESNLLEKSLKILGLGRMNTPLDVRYHYELMKKKKLDSRVDDIVTNAYNSLITFFSKIKEEEIEDLKKMSFKELEQMELEENPEYTESRFLDRTNESINNAINRLEKKLPKTQEVSQSPVKTSSLENQLFTIQELLNLPANASPHKVKQGYERYVEEYKNYTNKVIAHAAMKNISTDDLKDKLSQLEEVDKAYRQYEKKTGKK